MTDHDPNIRPEQMFDEDYGIAGMLCPKCGKFTRVLYGKKLERVPEMCYCGQPAANEITAPPVPAQFQGLTEGRIVHYVLDEGPYAGEHRPAVVVRVWNKHTGYVNLQVFVDGTNDAPRNQHPSEVDQAYYNGVMWVTSVTYSEGKETRTWHWIERA